MRQYSSAAAAILLVLTCFVFAQARKIPATESAALASRFRFERTPIPDAPGSPAQKEVRAVHPSLKRISAWVSSLGAAATLVDLDRDGLANDLIHVDPRTDTLGVMAVPGTGDRYPAFVLDPGTWNTPGYDPAALAPMGTLAGDFNEDGWIDILVYFWGRTPVLYLRRGGETTPRPALSAAAFVPAELSPSGERWYSTCAIQADLDGDGHLDLMIGNYFHDGARVLDARAEGTEVMHAGKSRALNGGNKHVFRWRSGTGGASPAVRYEAPQPILDDEVARGWTLALGAADLNGDLLPEIYIANDFGPDRLLHNRSTPGQFKFALLEGRRGFLTPKSCVLGHDSFKGMGVDFGDVNGDGLLDIFVSNIATRFGLTESHFLWLSTGEPEAMQQGIAPFVHGSEKLGLARSGFAFDARLADFDNDGVLEATQACGFIKGTINRWPELQALGTSNDRIVHNPRFWPAFLPGADLSGHDANPFFVRGSDGRYHNVAAWLGIDEPMVCRGIALADTDGDGRLDFVTANQWGPSFFFKNTAPSPGPFLGLRLVRRDGSPCIGAVARIQRPDGRKWIAQVDGGTGHSGRRSPEIHLGLSQWNPAEPVPVELRWRDRTGTPRKREVTLPLGWHTVLLEDGPVVAAHPHPIP